MTLVLARTAAAAFLGLSGTAELRSPDQVLDVAAGAYKPQGLPSLPGSSLLEEQREG
jgi:hypothetical protein